MTSSTYCAIGLLICLIPFICFLLSPNPETKHSQSIFSIENKTIIFSENATKLYDRFLAQLKYAKSYPLKTANDKVPNPENPLFQRTKTIQYLVDYTQTAIREIHRDKYPSHPNFHHIKCDTDTFSDTVENHFPMHVLQNAVEQYVNKDHSLYQHTLSKYTKKVRINEENNYGLNALIGQYGIFAKQTIKKGTCIGQYYGDEYLEQEYVALFGPYEDIHNHPFKTKRSYTMFYQYSDVHGLMDVLRLSDLDVTMQADAFFDYDHSELMEEDIGDENEAKQKQTFESLINDARTSLPKRLRLSDRLLRQNCEFVYCSVDGVMMVFLVTITDIKVDDQLFVYYGNNYV